PVDEIRTSEDVVISAVGRDLYEKFFKGYTRKQWGLLPSQLDKSVTARVPTRSNDDDRYFTDKFQAMPRDGYSALFAAMLDHPNIDIMLNVDFRDIADRYHLRHLVYTGPIDEYYGYKFGKLPYRSLKFILKSHHQEFFQSAAVVNYPDADIAYTRITEFKYLTGDEAPATTICYEYPQAEADPYYPIPRAENQAIFKQYEQLSLRESHVSFVGRLATYRYYNMDQVVAQALATYRRLRSRRDLPISKAASALHAS
ncbi:MAG: UDP-galactopyranose mutase, partial [Methylocystaceae bacterium]|nr:UDP-galactopyranose mutase [Methylocystaceae bacterium]